MLISWFSLRNGALLAVLLFLLGNQVQANVSDCIISISPLEQNYGNQRRDDLSFFNTPQGRATKWDERTNNLTISCPQEEHMALRFSGVSGADGDIALGNQGKVIIVISDAVLDGKKMQLIKTSDRGAITSVTDNSHQVRVGDDIAVGESLEKGRVLNATITTTPYLLESAFIVPDTQRVEGRLSVELLE
ncbi:hypothetical protein [Aeromonas veronii]|uniref:hypothetical protein n=1 Tax=Aeromonas veronii TaxID=654 RepID=UPI003BA127B2